MATRKSVWGIDIGECALKALRLVEVEGETQVDAFELIEHAEEAEGEQVDRHVRIRDALEQFLARQAVRGSTVVVAVPGQSSFTRFVKLPPVEKKRVPDIVRFEAEQQIPFPIEEVIWQWQTFEDPDSPDVEVGIFAMKRGDVAEMLAHFSEVGMDVDIVQMAPLSLYNFMTFDQQIAEEGATLLADVGADKTDLVVSDGPRIWTRTIQIGGNSFTRAVMRAFKLSFERAEKLKRTAASSKYARQIFQAMRPVFADLVQEIQRSIGYYTSLHRDSRFQKMLGLGNGFRLPGLQKFLEQNLNLPVARVDSYNALNVSDAVNAPQFTDNALSFAVAYGLAVQGMGGASVDTNLLPGEILRRRQWGKKRPWFAAAAAVLLACLGGPIYRAHVDRGDLQASQPKLREANRIVQAIKRQYSRYNQPFRNEFGQEIQVETPAELRRAALRLFRHRDFWPLTQAMLFRAIEQVVEPKDADEPNYQRELVAYARWREEWVEKKAAEREARNSQKPPGEELLKEIAELESKMKRFERTSRRNRKVIIVEGMESTYYSDLNDVGRLQNRGEKAVPAPKGSAGAGGAGTGKEPAKSAAPPRGFLVRITARTQMPQQAAIPQIITPLQRAITNWAKRIDQLAIVGYPVADVLPPLGGRDKARRGAAAAGGREVTADRGPEYPDPLLPDEDMAKDTSFVVTCRIQIMDDGLGEAPPEAEIPKPKVRPRKTSSAAGARRR